MSEQARVRLGHTEWTLWPDAVLRTPGFPARGLDAFAAPRAARAADEVLAGTGSDETFRAEFAAALAAGDAEIEGIIADPLFREALTWQNAELLDVFGGGLSTRSSTRRRQRTVVTRYWQRYCGKNETIGFFGPQLPITLDGSPVAVEAEPGPGLVRARRVRFEWWALAAFADTLGAEAAVRAWFPPRLAPHLTLRGRTVLRPAAPPLELSAIEALTVRRCTGRPAAEIVGALAADPESGIRSEADGYLLLDKLVERDVVIWDADLPLSPAAEDVLLHRIAAIGDERARARAEASFARMRAARDSVAAAVGAPETLRAKLSFLDQEFTAITGCSPRRRGGQAYAGRTLLYEETLRDLEVTIGAPVLDGISDALALLLHAARWLTGALAQAYTRALRDLHRELDPGDGRVPLAELWFLAQGLFWGEKHRPLDEAAAEFLRRWTGLFGLEEPDPDRRSLSFDSAALARAVHEAFPAQAPGWSSGRLHSPDLQICADSVAAINRGDYLVVLGELHAAWATLDSSVMIGWHPDLERLTRMLAEDLGADRVRPLYPPDWPRRTGRMEEILTGPGEHRLAFAGAPGARLDGLLAATALTVTDTGDELVASDADGRSWRLIEIFADLLAVHAADAFKLTSAGPHTPRITIDRLVIARESWWMTVGDTGVATVTGEADRYLAMRRFREKYGLPERAFVKIGTETKPCYVDFTAPMHCLSLCLMLRSAAGEGGMDIPVVFSELLPAPEHAWVPDSDGNRYFSELRVHATDPEVAR